MPFVTFRKRLDISFLSMSNSGGANSNLTSERRLTAHGQSPSFRRRKKLLLLTLFATYLAANH